MRRTATTAFGLFLLASLTGCGDGMATVNGTVMFDGKAVPDGAVTFVRSEGTVVREGGVIKDGKFQLRIPPGKYRVELNARKVVGKRTQKGFDGKDEELEITEDLFPEQFNAKSELAEEIRPGVNPLKLDLKSAR